MICINFDKQHNRFEPTVKLIWLRRRIKDNNKEEGGEKEKVPETTLIAFCDETFTTTTKKMTEIKIN